ncbi:bifunctional (p)ppGpp synthetase/guanosine-3',5'-bis(diphosphate) 3'-pyrophosphohydrolase [Comamonadaceae bacterium OH2545_COT-014]|nr:bifunctional (p)ppGpp synthetase/guanosine-3',5'-bis(diphosphate) 3'-pyrophosphohydrolase [Comamonadaceae bacterium OH2545_COT-014]
MARPPLAASAPPEEGAAGVPAHASAADSPTAIADAHFAALRARLGYLPCDDAEQITQAYRFAERAHSGQMRKNGEPYITHPIAVATQCAAWKLDAHALMAALLHDAMEDCGVTKADLAERFSPTVAELVDGLTKLDKLQFTTREENQAESFRKMLLAMARDVRVILIKLADRLHNMRTMGDMPRSKWGRISSETLEIYAPIAYRLGLHHAFRELQDLAFRHLKPWRYGVLTKAAQRARQRRRDLIQKVEQDVTAALAQAGLAARVSGREKTLYSIYRKMDDKRLSFAQVSDLYGVRIVMPSLIDCYTALGHLHQLYKPVPGQFRDYIAMPKVNGYQSLHTTLVGPASINLEFQIRTEQMDLVAESGVAAHWLYQSGGQADTDALGAQWLQSLLDIQNETRDANEFWDNVKVDLAPDAVYVFTPKGQIMALPQGATVVDFAYAIHSSVGDHTVSASVNGDPVPLRTALSNGDVIEIVTAPEAVPNPAWLGFVRTGRARSRIRHHLKTLAQSEAQDLGEKLLTQALRAEGMARLPGHTPAEQPVWDALLRLTGHRTREELMTDIGLGKRIATMVAKHLVPLLTAEGQRPDALLLSRERYTAHEKLSQGTVTLDGTEGAAVQYATCCRPVPGDALVGYLGRGEGLVVHVQGCAVARRLQDKDSERFIAVDWADEPARSFEAGITVTVSNGKGVLARVAAALAAAEADIIHLGMTDETAQQTTELHFVIGVRNTAHLDAVLRQLRRATSVLRAARVITPG